MMKSYFLLCFVPLLALSYCHPLKDGDNPSVDNKTEDVEKFFSPAFTLFKNKESDSYSILFNVFGVQTFMDIDNEEFTSLIKEKKDLLLKFNEMLLTLENRAKERFTDNFAFMDHPPHHLPHDHHFHSHKPNHHDHSENLSERVRRHTSFKANTEMNTEFLKPLNDFVKSFEEDSKNNPMNSKDELKDELPKSKDELKDELPKSKDELKDELPKSKDELKKDELVNPENEPKNVSKEEELVKPKDELKNEPKNEPKKES